MQNNIQSLYIESKSQNLRVVVSLLKDICLQSDLNGTTHSVEILYLADAVFFVTVFCIKSE